MKTLWQVQTLTIILEVAYEKHKLYIEFTVKQHLANNL